MTVAMTGLDAGPQSQQGGSGTGSGADSGAAENHGRARRTAPTPSVRTNRFATDDEILGIHSAAIPARANASEPDADFNVRSETAGTDADPAELDAASEADGASTEARAHGRDGAGVDEHEHLQAALDANPELRRAWQDAQSYREAFATPEEAQAATALMGDLNRMDALFFSQRPEDHAELARAVASLDPAAFASLAQAMNSLAASGTRAVAAGGETQSARNANRGAENQSEPEMARGTSQPSARNDGTPPGPSAAQMEFLHSANAAAVQGVLDAIETQVERLLPEGVSKSARNRVVGEIYRELDGSLAANRQLGQQMRDAFRSGGLDAAHQRAVVALITGRARQALPGIAKRVLNEWTSTVVAANQDRLARQRAAAHRVDIAGSGRGGEGGRRPIGPRDVDYGRMSDSDILNL
ncbi:MAG TPA: hypothetical protein VNK23_12450 [Candidatus Dormibacteraeota bacterium]|nr:hypothetical protein [Candidatus Dormibacteraeota bacterium]